MPDPRLVLALLALRAALAAQADTVKVFVLAGQSNMEGKAQNALLDRQASGPETRELFAHLRDGDGWAVRDDVFVVFGERRGRLTVGFGSPSRTGVELELGTALGEHIDEPVLLVKSAWGGHSLAKQFRPPSAGMPSDAALAAELAQARERIEDRNEKNGRTDPLPELAEIRDAYGPSYRQMILEVRTAQDRCGTWFPALRGRRPELAGFVWFQGWNDQYGGAEQEYAANLRHLIADVRRDFGTPDLPVVIAAMGQNGSRPATGAMKVIQDAQLAVNDDPELRATVRGIRTDVLVDVAAERLYPTWQENREQWDRTGSDHPYHYLGSAIWFGRIGRAMAAALLELNAGR